MRLSVCDAAAGTGEEGWVGDGKKAAGELTAALVFEASITASDTLPGLT